MTSDDSMPYPQWLARLENPQRPAAEQPLADLMLETQPDGLVLDGLTNALGAITTRFGLRALDHPPRVALIVSAAWQGIDQVYLGRSVTGEITAIADRIAGFAAERASTADLVLVQTLPPTAVQADDETSGLAGGTVLDAFNAHLVKALSDLAAANVQAVPVDRLIHLDTLVACADWPAVADSLAIIGRQDRLSQLWCQTVDLAWLHWRAIASRFGVPAKVIATDLDGVLWPGTIAEDGADGVIEDRHSLKNLSHRLLRAHLTVKQSAGVLLAGVSKNDEHAARLALGESVADLPITEVIANPAIDKVAALEEVLVRYDGVAPDRLIFLDGQVLNSNAALVADRRVRVDGLELGILAIEHGRLTIRKTPDKCIVRVRHDAAAVDAGQQVIDGVRL